MRETGRQGDGVGDTAAIYCRISRDSEGERVGVTTQEKECRKLAERLGFDVVRVFTDNDTGASDKTRKSKVRHEYNEMLQWVRDGRVKRILSYSNSRLTRRMSELEDLVTLHHETKVFIHTVVSGDADLSTADGLTKARIMASIDAGEALRISERTKLALRHKAESGEPRITSNRPFGWKADGKTLDPVEARLIREGVADLIRGVPLNLIRKRWIEEGVKTPAGRSEWHWTNTMQVLTSWRTVGVRTYNGEVLLDQHGQPVEGKWEAIVSREDRERALAQVRARSLTRRRTGKYLLSGLLRCGECSKPMWGSTKAGQGRADQYVCSGGTGHVSIDSARLERHMVMELHLRLAHRAYGKGGVEDEQPDEGWPGESELAEVLKQTDELMTAYRNRVLTGTVVFPQVAVLEQDAARLRKERDAFLIARATPNRVADGLFDYAGFLRDAASAPWEQKHALLRNELETIVILKGVKGAASRDRENFARRVEPVWKPEA